MHQSELFRCQVHDSEKSGLLENFDATSPTVAAKKFGHNNKFQICYYLYQLNLNPQKQN